MMTLWKKALNFQYKNILDTYNNGFNLSRYGQYYFTSVNSALNKIYLFEELPETFSENIIMILNQEYIYELDKFNFNTIDELKIYTKRF